MTVGDREVALEREAVRIHILAGDNGHDLHNPWNVGDDCTTSTFCRRCGADAAVRVYKDGRVWSGGKLTHDVECGQAVPNHKYNTRKTAGRR